MKHTEQNNVKVLFRFHSDLFDQEIVETMWATKIDEVSGLYQLDNIPFYAPLVANGDIIFAEYDVDEEQLTYRKTVEPSGNSTVQVVLMDDTQDVNEIRAAFRELSCESEKANAGYFSMDVPATTTYQPIKQKLDEMEQLGTIDYAEPCLSKKHQF